MPKSARYASLLALLASPALAQEPPPPPPPYHHHHHHHHYHHHHYAGPPGERPVDVGPNTPEADRAYQGGGEVLQGQPGGPPPVPRGNPPG